jgi:hypothetical protein
MSRDLKLVLLTVGAVMAIALVYSTWKVLNPPKSPEQQRLEESTERLRELQR